jgi:hypothetical protein
MFRCSRCKEAVYANRDEQLADWPVHVLVCQPVALKKDGTELIGVNWANGAGEDDKLDNIVIGQVITVNNFTSIRLLTLNDDAVFQAALAYATTQKLDWKLQRPRSWVNYGTGPHITLKSDMRTYNGELVKV